MVASLDQREQCGKPSITSYRVTPHLTLTRCVLASVGEWWQAALVTRLQDAARGIFTDIVISPMNSTIQSNTSEAKSNTKRLSAEKPHADFPPGSIVP